jgi:hypothetical protein
LQKKGNKLSLLGGMLRVRQDVQAKAEEATAVAGGRGVGVDLQGEGGPHPLLWAAGGASRLWADR